MDKSRQWSVESFFQNYLRSMYYCKIITNQSSAHFLSRTRARCAHEKEIERLGPSDRLRKRERETKRIYFLLFFSSSSLGIGGTIGSTGGRRHRNILL